MFPISRDMKPHGESGASDRAAKAVLTEIS